MGWLELERRIYHMTELILWPHYDPQARGGGVVNQGGQTPTVSITRRGQSSSPSQILPSQSDPVLNTVILL